MSGEPHIPSMSSSTDHTVAEAYHLTPTYHDVVIAGAGVSAIAMAIQLERKLSITNTLLIEKETDLGGTWYLNSCTFLLQGLCSWTCLRAIANSFLFVSSTDPGCACDVPAPFYSFSFEPKADWSCLHPPQAELHQYFADVAKKWKVPQRTRLQTRVVEARFDEVTGLWHTIAQDVSKDPAKHPPEFSHYVSKLFVLAVGGLSHPTEFKAKGYDQFQGATFHSQRWDHSVDFEGKDVVVVGNGCTATQIVPHLQKKVKRLTQFASSKHWIAPEPKNPLSGVPGAHWILRNIPIIAWLYRAMIFLFSESMFGMMRLGRFGEWYRNRWHQLCVNYIKQHAPAKYWDALIPTEEELPVGCRRRIFDNGSYLHSLKAPNVELIGERLDQFGTDWVQTQDGRRIHADIVVLCTGYIAAICAKTPIRIYGRKGEELHDHWDRYGVGAHFAYRSTLQAGFPNMSVLVGSNSTTGHSRYVNDPLSTSEKWSYTDFSCLSPASSSRRNRKFSTCSKRSSRS